jgi:hypothetical protein
MITMHEMVLIETRESSQPFSSGDYLAKDQIGNVRKPLADVLYEDKVTDY